MKVLLSHCEHKLCSNLSKDVLICLCAVLDRELNFLEAVIPLDQILNFIYYSYKI